MSRTGVRSAAKGGRGKVATVTLTEQTPISLILVRKLKVKAGCKADRGKHKDDDKAKAASGSDACDGRDGSKAEGLIQGKTDSARSLRNCQEILCKLFVQRRLGFPASGQSVDMVCLIQVLNQVSRVRSWGST